MYVIVVAKESYRNPGSMCMLKKPLCLFPQLSRQGLIVLKVIYHFGTCGTFLSAHTLRLSELINDPSPKLAAKWATGIAASTLIIHDIETFFLSVTQLIKAMTSVQKIVKRIQPQLKLPSESNVVYQAPNDISHQQLRGQSLRAVES